MHKRWEYYERRHYKAENHLRLTWKRRYELAMRAYLAKRIGASTVSAVPSSLRKGSKFFMSNEV